MGGEQGFANQTEKNIYSNLGVVGKLRTHPVKLQVANAAKGSTEKQRGSLGCAALLM